MDQKCIDPAILTFNSLINACAKAGDISRAEHWLRETFRRGLTPDSISYSTIIHACVEAKELTRAEQWLEEMHNSSCSEQPNAFSYNFVVQAFARRGNLLKAEHWLTTANSVGIRGNMGTFSSLIAAYVKTGHLEEACRWL